MSIPKQTGILSLKRTEGVNEVGHFRYLGGMVRDLIVDINYRKGLAWASFWEMKSVWRAKIFHYT